MTFKGTLISKIIETANVGVLGERSFSAPAPQRGKETRPVHRIESPRRGMPPACLHGKAAGSGLPVPGSEDPWPVH